MPGQRSFELRFPMAGVVRRHGHWADFAHREAYPTPWAVNVRPEDSAGRLRGSSWPGITAITRPVSTVVSIRLVNESGQFIVTETDQQIVVMEQVSIRPVTTGGNFGWVRLGSKEITDSTVACLYRDRLCIVEDQVVAMSRQGVHDDWDYGADVEDAGRAFLFQLSEAGEEGTAVTALIPHKDSFLLTATADSLWVLSGDPVDGGTLRNVSRDVGVLSNLAWCKGSEIVYFLSKHGLYAVRPDGSELTPLSVDKIPEELRNVNPAARNPYLEYRYEDQGFYVVLSGIAYDWFYHLPTSSFWPFASGNNSAVLIGPVRLSPGADVAILTEIEAAMSEGSGNVNWHLIVGNSAEEVAVAGMAAIGGNTSGVKASGVFGGGRSRRYSPRLRGQWAVVLLSSTGQWAYEWLILRVLESGRQKL